jgi:hypothetical protein
LNKTNNNITPVQYAKFYLPLAITGVMLVMNHSTSSSAVARSADPAIGLSAYASAFAVGNLFEIMCFGMQRMALTFVKGKKSFRVVFSTALKVLAVIMGTMAILAWTPLSRLLTDRVLALTPEVAAKMLYSLRVMILWPFVSAIRSIFQSLVVVSKRTGWTTVAMGVRLGVSLLGAILLPRLWPTGPVGALILVGGLAAEMIVSILASAKFIPPLAEESDEESIPTTGEVLRFFLPLALAQVATPLVRNIMIGSLARTVNAELTLSGYQVATSVSGIMGAVAINMYQPVMVFVRDRVSFRKIRKYSMVIGVVACIMILVCGLPSIGPIVFERIMGAPPDIAASAMGALVILALNPLIISLNEFNLGILMLKKRTVFVTAAKIINAVVCGLTIITLTTLFPEGGAMLAAISTVMGISTEAIFLYFTVRLLPECAEYHEKVIDLQL